MVVMKAFLQRFEAAKSVDKRQRGIETCRFRTCPREVRPHQNLFERSRHALVPSTRCPTGLNRV